MNYRISPKNGEKLSILGYGCMRFPSKNGSIDEERTERQIRSAIEQGVNYFDTAYIYLNGKSETILGKILAKGYRDKVNIATKLPPFMVRTAADIDKIFNKQLERLQTGRIDYYLMHMLSDLASWERLKSLGIESWIEQKKQSGEIRNIGFSYHGGRGEFKKIVDSYDWDFCQIQYNFLDENNQAGKTGLQYAASKGLPVIIMEPLRGGKIVTSLPNEVKDIWKNAKPSRSAAEWALRWIWNQPEATVVLSGMNEEAQIEENIRIASEVQPGKFSENDLQLFTRVRDILLQKSKVGCTGCGYCMPCPSGVDIPTCFSCLNDKYRISQHGNRFKYMQSTGAFSKKPGSASQCIQCGKCEKHCPQGIPIREKLEEVRRELEGPLFKPTVFVARKIMRTK